MAITYAGDRTPRILFVDAYDSFSENVVALLRHALKAHVVTIRIDDGIDGWNPTVPNPAHDFYDAIVIGPGPGSPDSSADTGRLDEIWNDATEHRIPVLGICLGFQSLCSRYGLAVTPFDMPCHGHTKRICHQNLDIFQDVGEIVATNYNSLGVRAKFPIDVPSSRTTSSSASARTESSRPESPRSVSSSSDGSTFVRDDGCHLLARDLKMLAVCEDGYVMAVKHIRLPFWGLQFHPESCLSNTACYQVLINWWTKVQEHNGMFRKLRQDLQPHARHDIASADCTTDCESPELIRLLRELLQSYTGRVSFRCLNSNISIIDMTRMGRLMCDDDTAVRLESSKRGRFSIYGATHQQSWLLEQVCTTCQIRRQGKIEFALEATTKATLAALEEVFSSTLVVGGAEEVPFWGGLIGYVSYEAGLDLVMPHHQHPYSAKQPRTVPNLSLRWIDRSIVHDKETGQVWVQSLRGSDNVWIDEMVAKLQVEMCSPGETTGAGSSAVPPSTTAVNLPDHASYISGIHSCQSQLHAGNSYELCLTTEATIKSCTAPDVLYASLQSVNAALYSAYLRLDRTTILSCSPEQFLSWCRSEPQLDMTPMKGTIAKGPEVTRQKAQKLLRTPKEEAENLMIVDLIRHDLHRSLAPHGSVEVKSLYELVETENTYQLISHIRGHIPLEKSVEIAESHAEVVPQRQKSRQIMRYGHKTLRTALPPGSMTGAPKIRSCSILAGLEQRYRGVYSGVIGYFDIGGGGCWSVAIRCAFSHASEDQLVDGETHRTWHVGAGGAITVLSDDEQEWDEMRVKMGGVLKGFGADIANQ